MSSSEAQSLDRHKFSVLSFQSSVTTGRKAIADSGQLVPNPQPRTPRPDSPALSARIQVHVFEFAMEGKAPCQKNADRGYPLQINPLAFRGTCVSTSRLARHARATLATCTPVEILARAKFRIFFEGPFGGELPEPSQGSDDYENLGDKG